jgi:RNA polymerase sigma factor (sigma-70 family)
MSEEAIDRWISRLNEGDVAAVEQVFIAYEPYLRMAVRRRLNGRIRAEVDSGDVVQSVFADVVRGVRGGTWRFEGRAQLLGLLKQIARRRVADRYAKRHRSAGKEEPLAELISGDVPASPLPRPSQEVEGRELWSSVLNSCNPAHHEVVRLRRSGFRLAEIAQRTGMHEGSVRRILYELARRMSIDRHPTKSRLDKPT